ncbi:MAG: hypothetical protein HY203_07200 [Nitrospirae bacterium]|nr:hypothetical protein [Nitrospirota bacterium]
MRRIAGVLVFILGGMIVVPRELYGAPTPYFGYPHENSSTRPDGSDNSSNLQTVLLGGEWIESRKGDHLQRLGLLSWEKDFVLKTPRLTFVDALVESDGGRLTFELPASVNPYIVFIAEYPYFYHLSEQTGRLTETRFRGLGMGGGIVKRNPIGNIRAGAEWVSGKLDGDVKETGQKTMELIQFEQDRTQRTKWDEPTDGTRLFFSFSTLQFHGFASEPEKAVATVQGVEEWYHPLSPSATFGLVAREGADSRSARFWSTTVGSLQEDDFNVPLPGYLYQQFAVKAFIDGEVGLGFRPTPDWSFHLGYDAAGGWSPHVYGTVSAGVTYLLFHKLPLNLQGAWGLSPSGAAEVLAGTALQW